MKHLFVFAAYEPSEIISPSLLYYLDSAHRCGDIVVSFDNELSEAEQEKLSRLVCKVITGRHGEYDFGSYKRAFLWAKDNLSLNGYDVVYFVNDSVYGPAFSFENFLERLERQKRPFFGPAALRHRDMSKSHLQSWFWGFRQEVFLSVEFENFVSSITRQESKQEVCMKYERGMAHLFPQYDALYYCRRKEIYRHPKHLLDVGIPFIKKNCFVRHHYAMCYSLRGVLDRFGDEIRNAVMESLPKEAQKEIRRASLVRSLWNRTRYILDKV